MFADAGTRIVIDELMSMWYGRGGNDGLHAWLGLPHISKIIRFFLRACSQYLHRKPRSIGAEMVVSAECTYGCIIRVELQVYFTFREVHCSAQEGATAMAKKAFCVPEGIRSSTASVLRVVQPWLNIPERTFEFYGDARFSSFYTCEELLKRGHHYSGPVKTATKKFPKAALIDTVQQLNRGDSVCATTQLRVESGRQSGDHQIRAMAWLDKTPQTMISTHLTSGVGVSTKCLFLVHII